MGTGTKPHEPHFVQFLGKAARGKVICIFVYVVWFGNEITVDWIWFGKSYHKVQDEKELKERL